MSIDYWAQRWKSGGSTAFHEGAANALLEKHIARLETKTPLRIFVPLSGKAIDMSWLAGRGHEVVGVELVPDALDQFFAEAGVKPAEKRIGGHRALSHDRVTIVNADIFAVTAETLGTFDVVYDRAALVALDPSERKRYVAACRTFAERTFLVTLAYDQTKAPGPPWSVDDATVNELYAGRTIDKLEARTVGSTPRLTEAGILELAEAAYAIA